MTHRLTIPLTDNEMKALRQSAQQDIRRPRDQARYIVLKALGLHQKSEDTGNSLATEPVSSEPIHQPICEGGNPH